MSLKVNEQEMRWTILLLFLLIGTGLQAQDRKGELKGVVKDGDNEEPLIGVTLILSQEGVFYEGAALINKIRVIPKRSKDRVWSGTIYIVEDAWEFYGAELTTTGEAIQLPFIKELVFKQNFTFDNTQNFWVKI